MSTTPGVGELTTQISPAEATVSRAGKVAPVETASVNAGLAATLEASMAKSPADSVDAGIASLTDIDIDQIPAPTVPKPTAETAAPETTPMPTESPTAPAENKYFPYVAEAKKALTEAKARGASQEDIDSLELKLQQATNKEGLLMSGISLIQIDKEITEARKRNASPEELAELNARKAEIINKRSVLYEEIFKQIKAQVARNKERDPRTFEQMVDDLMLKEAKEIQDAMQLGLERATEAGVEDEIETAKLRLQAAEMHVETIKKKKGRGIKSLLNSMLLSLGATVLTDTFKVSKGEITPQRGH